MRQSASFFNRSRIMTSLPANASPLRQRMIDDMRMRQLAPRTQDIYLHIVREFARFLGRSPDTATVEDLRRYQLYLVDHGTSAVSLNHAITGLKFFFTVTLDRPELMVRMQPVRVPRILHVAPEVTLPPRWRHCTASSLRQRPSSIPPGRPASGTAEHTDRSIAIAAKLQPHRGTPRFPPSRLIRRRPTRAEAPSHSCGRWQASNNP
jgi:hypothetical protein